MGKVKSAIITALVVAAVVVLSLFAVISCDLVGTNGVSRYNSFLSSIHLGGSLSGEAHTLLYPEGVISVSDYSLVVDDAESSEKEDYEEKYEKHGGVYVDKDKLADETFKESVKKDANIISNRFSEKGYTAYSVTVEDDYVIRVSVPSNFTYAQYKGNDDNSTALRDIGNAVQYLTLNGDLSLRNGTDYDTSSSILSVRDDFSDYFSGVSFYQMGGTRAVRMTLTAEGYNKLNSILTASTDTSSSVYVFVGEVNTQLTFTMGTALESNNLFFTPESVDATDYAILLGSVINGNVVSNEFNTGVTNTVIVSATSAFGEHAAIYLMVALLLVIVAVGVASVVKYKKLGLVNLLMAVIYSLIMVCALLLLEIQLTVGGAFTAVLGLALFTFTNFIVFEAVRKETLSGRTIQASIKTGYKKSLWTVLDLHILLLIAAIFVALVCVGELAACGLIFLIAVLASYALHWFTRLMWFVISSLDKDKFKFCGFKREVLEDED